MKRVQVKAIQNEIGLDDIGASGLTFSTNSLTIGKIYTEVDTIYWTESAKRKPPFIVDDCGCSRDIEKLLDNKLVELVGFLEEKPKCPECLKETSQHELDTFSGYCEDCFTDLNLE